MLNLKQIIEQAAQNKQAVGHFNVANLEMLKATFLAGQELSKEVGRPVPLIIGLSESERRFVGSRQMVGFIKSLREEHDYPIFVNADHCHTLESVKSAAEEGFDSIVIDNSAFSLEENIKSTAEAVKFVKENYPDTLVEGEIGVIGQHSMLLDEVPEKVVIGQEQLTTVEDALKFVQETGVDCFAPAVGNIHGMLKNSFNPNLDIERIKEIADKVKVILVLHGGSGIKEEDVKKAISSGMSVVHISTELRRAYSLGVQNLNEDFFASHPDEVTPYKIMASVVVKVQEVVRRNLELFIG